MIGIQLYEKSMVQEDLTTELVWEVIHEYEDAGTRMMVIVNSKGELKTIAFNSLEWEWNLVLKPIDLNL